MKTLMLPGWMSRVKNYQIGEGRDIWIEFGDPMDLPAADYVIGHSLGCHYALSNWRNGRDNKLILVNPPIFKRNSFVWLYRWLTYRFREGLGVSFRDIKVKDLLPGIKNCLQLFRPDFRTVIKKLPKDRITVVKGEHDNYFCDREAAAWLRQAGVKLIEVPGAGHNWDESIRQAVQSLIV